MTSLLLSVLRRGTEEYPTLQAINQKLDSLYGAELSIRNFYRGDYQVIGFSLDLLRAEYVPGGEIPLKEALEVVAEILFHPRLDENGLLLASYVEDEKRYQQDVIRSIKNNPSGYAMDRCQALFYQDRPCALPIYGSVEELESVTPERLTAHWKKLLCKFRPECFFVGSLKKDTLEEALRATVGKELKQARLPDSTRRFFSTVGHGETEHFTEEFPACQSHLVVGLTTGVILGDPDYYAVKLYNEILLGSSPVSKLFLELREKRSLCYSCVSSYQAYTGAIFIRCGLSKENSEKAKEEITHQMCELAKGHFSGFELEAAKNAFLTVFHSIEDSPEAMESYFFGRSIMGLDISLEETCRAISEVTREDVIRVAKQVKWNTEFFLVGTGKEKADTDENEED